MGSLDTFVAVRPALLSLAYRMLGEIGEAEDVVQETWVRWQTVDEAAIEKPRAWLSAVASRLCLDRLKSARHRRETYEGPWLPEPVTTDGPPDRESISLAFLALLERLSPVERAAFLMHQVFDYTHEETAAALGLGAAAVRQAFHRAKDHLAANRPRFAPSPTDHARMLAAFAGALASSDLSTLVGLLSHDATLYADSGGKVRGAAMRPIAGAERIARFLLGLARQGFVEPNLSFDVREVNGWPALVACTAASVVAVINIETDGQRIVAIRNLVNPEKLALRDVRLTD
jgi:RNA polymerase sigma-70 factor (ECF subfamily)